jgi:hypothetical protein
MEHPDPDAAPTTTTTSPATRAADERDADAEHRADRPPTPAEEAEAEEWADRVDPQTGEHYAEMAELGAEIDGEGRVEG